MYIEQKANGALTRENKNAIIEIQENAKKYTSKISTHSQQEEEIERGCEK